MTTKTDTEQERAEFEAWAIKERIAYRDEKRGVFFYNGERNSYWIGYQAGRAALQSQSIPASDWFDMFMELARDVVVANRLFAVSPTTTKQKVAADAAIALQEHARKHPALQSQDREDAERYRYLITKLQQVYDGDYFETDLMSLYCHMPSQYKGERTVRAEITWRDKSDEPIGLSEAIDHARSIEGDGE